MTPMTATHLMDIQHDGNLLIVALRHPVNDLAHLEDLEDALRSLLSLHEQRMILIDFAEVNLVVSRLINSLLLLVKRVRAEGGQVHLCNLDTKVERVFKTMKLDRVFDIYLTREEGVATMRALDNQYRMAQFA
ncbi:MAG: hypothetical protein HJJLKODD_02116 [Phycisphaerae bacterium]|nr:hypothetical protein [Phycisphaerae bacterium]